jgi:hypothetical protein
LIVLTANYELCVRRKSHLRDHPKPKVIYISIHTYALKHFGMVWQSLSLSISIIILRGPFEEQLGKLATNIKKISKNQSCILKHKLIKVTKVVENHVINKKPQNNSRDPNNNKESNNRRDTFPEGLTAAQETTGTAGDTNNNRNIRSGGNTIKRREFTTAGVLARQGCQQK